MEELNEIAETALTDAKGDRSLAARNMEHTIRSRPELIAELTAKFIQEAIWERIGQAAYRLRAAYWSSGNNLPRPDQAEGLRIIARRQEQSILDGWFLSSNKPLGDATRDELKSEAEMHEHLATANAVKARFYLALARKMRANGTVRTLLSEKIVNDVKDAIIGS